MSITFRNKTFSVDTSVGYTTPGEPSGTAANDVMFLFGVCDADGLNANNNNDWTLLASADQANTHSKLWWGRRGGGAKDTRVNASGTGSWLEVHCSGYVGANQNNTPNQNNYTASGNNPNCPAINANNGDWVLAFGMGWVGLGSNVTLASYTMRVGNPRENASMDSALATREITSNGSEDPAAYAGFASGTADVFGVTVQLPFEGAGGLSLNQAAFRFRNDDGAENNATWHADQNANVTRPQNTALRIRFRIDASNGDPGAANYQLEFRKSGSGWNKVGTE